MPGATLTTVDKILKEVYLPPIRDQLTDGEVLWNKFQKNHEDISGRTARFPLHYGRNAGIGSAAEDAALPTAGSQLYKEVSYTLKYMYGSMRITGQTIKMTKNDRGAFARALERELQGLSRDFKHELNRIINGDASGTLTQVNGTTGAQTVITVDSTRFLTDGMAILIDSDAATIVTVDSETQITITPSTATIVTVDSETQITITPSTTVADNDVIKRANADEPNGIANIIDSGGTIGGLAASGNLWWQSYEAAATAPGDLSLADMQTLFRKIEERKNAPPTFFYGKHVLRDKYAALLVADKRFVNTMELDGGFKGVEFNGIPFVTDWGATDGTLYAVTPEHFMIFEPAPVDWMDEDGNILQRDTTPKDAYSATLFYYWQVGTDNRRFQGKLTGVNE